MALEEGMLEIQWISESSFRYWRGWAGKASGQRVFGRDEVPVRVSQAPDSVELETRYLRVRVSRRDGVVKVERAQGGLLMQDAEAPRIVGERVILERASPGGEQFRGLGTTAELEGARERKLRVQTSLALLISSLGYGEYFPTPGDYLYRFGERRRVEAPGRGAVEYFFYFGPTPLEILEEHARVKGGLSKPGWEGFLLESRVPRGAVPLLPLAPTWDGLRQLLRGLERASYSAILLPAVDVHRALEGNGEARDRTLQLAVYLPVVYRSKLSGDEQAARRLSEARGELLPYLASYSYEARDRGLPLLRPLAMQYPRDTQAGSYADEFMLGDELLVAPIIDPAGKRSVYLPMGLWTELHTNRRYQGRSLVEVKAPPEWIPVFARNGSILPLASPLGDDVLSLHYFPRLAAEFFLYERGSGALTQFHAGPAGEWMRLEVESAVERRYEWVIHHVSRPSKVWTEQDEYYEVGYRDQLRRGTWWHDAARGNLHIRTQTAGGAGHVIKVSF